MEQGETGKRMLKTTEKSYDQSTQGIFISRNQDIKAKQKRKLIEGDLDSALRKHDF